MTNVLAIAEGAGDPAPRPDLQQMAEHVAAGGSPFDYVDPPDWFSYSAFDMFERCPRQYALRYLCRLPAEPSRPAAEFGSIAHASFQAFTRDRRERHGRGEAGPDRADLERHFEAAWAASCLSAAPDAQMWRDRARPMLDAFWTAESETRSATLGEELRFRLYLRLDPGTRVAVTGFIDRVDRLASGGIEVVDYKTGGPWSSEEAESSLQLSIYALGCRDGLEIGRPELVTLNFVEHGLRYSAERTDAALDSVRDEIGARARQIRAGEFAPAPSRRACDWCDYAAICRASTKSPAEIPLVRPGLSGGPLS
jgi:putative RecB family exonuclease